MSSKFGAAIIAGVLISGAAYGQTELTDPPPAPSPYEYFFSVNGNLYLPVRNSDKGVYPVLWYDKKTDPKLLIGGVGVGLSVLRPVKDKISVKGQINLSRHAYWNTPIEIKDQNNQVLGTLQSNSFSYTVGVAVTGQYFLTPKFSIGTGFGAQVVMLTMSRTPDQSKPNGTLTVDHNYRLLLPVLPFEISYKLEKMLFNIRYEYGLINNYKHDLQFYKRDQMGLLTFEIGYRI